MRCFFGKTAFSEHSVLILAILLAFGISRFPDGMIHGFRIFATVIRSAGTIGIALGAFSYMTGSAAASRSDSSG